MRRLRPLLLTLVALGLGGCERRADGLAGPTAPGLSIRVDWRVRAPDIFFATRPTADATRLYAESSSGAIHAFDLATGALVWSAPAPEGELFGPPVVQAGRVLAVGIRARAFDAQTGVPLWERPVGEKAQQWLNAAADGRFFYGVGGVVQAVSVETGDSLWANDIGGQWPLGGLARAVHVLDGTVYACVQEIVDEVGYGAAAHVVALDAVTGATRWSTRLQYETGYNFCAGEPVVAGDLVTVADLGGNNYVALDRRSGAPRWRHRGAPGWLGPFVAPAGPGDTLFAAANDRSIHAFDRATGRVLWRAETRSSARHAVPCGRIVLASDYGLWVFDRATGRLLANDEETYPARNDMLVSRFIVRGDTAWVAGMQSIIRIRCRR